MSNGLQQTINFMLPAVGTPRGYVEFNTFVPGTPVNIDFRNVSGGSIDGQPFRPSGVYIDNTNGTGDLSVKINEMQYTMICPAGGMLNLPFPAPTDLSVTINGNGDATIIFVDTPVQPYRSF